MGDITAMYSIDRFIEKHGDQIRQECLAGLPTVVRALCPTIILGNDIDRLEIWAEFPGPEGVNEALALAPLELDAAIARDQADWGSDCQMGR